MFRTKIAIGVVWALAGGLAGVLAACSATPKDGEKMEADVRMQPLALSTDADPARCAARAVLMHRSRVTADWGAAVETPTTLYVPRNARVIELVCVPAGGGGATTRYLGSEESAEAKSGQAATGAMFLLLGGLPALATGAAQRTDVYEFPAAVTVALPPAASAAVAGRAAFAAARSAEIERDTAEWRRLRWAMCEAEQSPGASALDDHCERGLAEIKKRKEQMSAELASMQTAQN